MVPAPSTEHEALQPALSTKHMSSDLLPIFPLPNVVLFPNVFLPLHIFEPRYREMVSDSL